MAQDWNSLALSNEQTRFYQLYEYRSVIEKVFGYKSLYLMFKDGNDFVGQLPLYNIKTLLFNKIVSIPFSEHGGIISNSYKRLDFDPIVRYLDNVLKACGAKYIEINAGLGLPADVMTSHFRHLNFHHYAELKLSDEDAIFRRLDHPVRKAINKAVRCGVTAFQDSSEQSIREFFYPLFLQSMRRLGTPALSIDYFLECKRCFGDKMRIFFAQVDKRIVAALLGYVAAKRVYIQLIASDERAHDKRPVDLIHWEFIKWALRTNVEFFDFGLVRYDGQKQFKLKWGCDLKGYRFYYFYPVNRGFRRLPQPLTPLSDDIRFFKLGWKFLPRAAQYQIGPWIRKNLAK